MEVVLAKPQTDKKTEGTFPYSPGLVPTHLPHAGYGGFAGTPYGSVGTGFGVAAGFQQVHEYIFKFVYLSFMESLTFGIDIH